MTYSFEIVSDLYQAGRTEDGEAYTAEVYYVMAEDEDGNRWQHFAAFPGCEVSIDPEDGFQVFGDIREAARAQAERLLKRIQAASVINMQYWSEMSPCYGSKAYQQYGQQQDWYAEKNGQPYKR